MSTKIVDVHNTLQLQQRKEKDNDKQFPAILHMTGENESAVELWRTRGKDE